VVDDIAEVGPKVSADARQVRMLQPSADLNRRGRHQAQLLQLTPQLVDARDPRLIKWLQDMLLERLDLGCELLDDDEIVVDDEVDQSVEDVVLAMG
jgi:hypothetical protein